MQNAPEREVAARAARASTAPPPVVLPGVRRITPAPQGVLAEPPRAKHKHRWLPWLLVVLVLELAAGAAVIAASRLVWNHATVPRVVGLQFTVAAAVLRDKGLLPEVSGEPFQRRVPPQAGSSPSLLAAARREKTDSIVKMVISEGRAPDRTAAVVRA